MESALKELIAKLPVRSILYIIAFVLTWIAGLTIAGVITHRSVEFFPPKIGSDPVLQREISELTNEVKRLTDYHLAYRGNIFAAQQKAMDDLISIRRSISYGEHEAKSNIEKYSELLRNEDSKMLKAIEDLNSKVTILAKQF